MKNIKDIVREKYSMIARQSENSGASCCDPAKCCADQGYSVFSESYQELEGYNPDADMQLGCGIPTEYAGINPGDHVLDLGSGAGNDCFVARSLTGESGKVTGLDFSDEMLAKARENTERLGYLNVDFVKGDIEQMPLADDQFNVILSNCVLNLVPDKVKAFSEMMRVLKSGGHFCVSDVVVDGTMPENLRASAEMYAGCVSGAIGIDEYVGIIEQSGFGNIKLHKKRKLDIPAEILREYLEEEEINDFNTEISGLYSITISAVKP